MNDKKPREQAVIIQIDRGDSIEGVWSDKEQKLSLRVIREGKVVSARKIFSTVYYRRTKNLKFINKIEFDRSSSFTLCDLDVLAKYDCVWAIDTNTRELFNELANVSAITEVNTKGGGEFSPTLGMVFGKSKGKPELYGWKAFIDLIESNVGNSHLYNFALVVDSELGMLGSFNDRLMPIYGDFLLPSNWTLIYATADKGNDSIFNKMIKESDKSASKVFGWLAKNPKNRKHWSEIVDENKHFPTLFLLSDLGIKGD